MAYNAGTTYDTRLMHRTRYYSMGEQDVREALHDTVITQLYYADPVTRVIDEFVVEAGRHRVDVAAINGEMHAFEIKSANDTLDRLCEQQESYNKVFDRITLVVDERHVDEAVKLVQPWWGLTSVTRRDGKPVLDEIWRARPNFKQDAYALAQLLWREEALRILEMHRLAVGMHRQTRKRMWQKLAREMPLQKLKTVVRQTLKYRKDWR
ncbi:MAG TPA: sce7726 family protein [Candidatus Obscuribacterales bacterium]